MALAEHCLASPLPRGPRIRGTDQEELALRLKTQKTAISRIENHAEDIKLSTLDRVAKALGKQLQIIYRIAA